MWKITIVDSKHLNIKCPLLDTFLRIQSDTISKQPRRYHHNPGLPWMVLISAGLIGAPSVFISTSPCFGSGTDSSCSCSTFAGSPNSPYRSTFAITLMCRTDSWNGCADPTAVFLSCLTSCAILSVDYLLLQLNAIAQRRNASVAGRCWCFAHRLRVCGLLSAVNWQPACDITAAHHNMHSACTQQLFGAYWKWGGSAFKG